MEKAEQIRQWLGQGTGVLWLVDCLGKKSGSGGVFPTGRACVSEKTDILGNKQRRLRDSYLLKLRLAASAESDGVGNCRILSEIVELPGCPRFGENQTAAMEKARLLSTDGATAVYTAELTVEYDA